MLQVLEVCCKKGLAQFAGELLRKNADPDLFGSNSLTCPVLEACDRGDVRMLRILRRYEADFTVVKRETRETVLHAVLNSVREGREEEYLSCLRMLLDNRDEELYDQVRRIVVLYCVVMSWCIDVLYCIVLYWCVTR